MYNYWDQNPTLYNTFGHDTVEVPLCQHPSFTRLAASCWQADRLLHSTIFTDIFCLLDFPIISKALHWALQKGTLVKQWFIMEIHLYKSHSFSFVLTDPQFKIVNHAIYVMQTHQFYLYQIWLNIMKWLKKFYNHAILFVLLYMIWYYLWSNLIMICASYFTCNVQQGPNFPIWGCIITRCY